MSTLKDRRKADRERQEKYRERQAQMGKKTITATISAEAYAVLQKIKKRDGLTNSSAVELALLSFGQE